MRWPGRRPRRRLLVAVTLALLGVGALPSPAVAAPGPDSAPEYWFDSWQVPALWSSGARGQGITIAEIDTGVNVVPELRGRVLSGTDLSTAGGNGQVDRDNEEFGHGTAMASIMVARSGTFSITGLAPDARILPIAVPLNGTAEAGQPDQLAEAIRYGVDHGAKIINMSLGGKRSRSADSIACPADEQEAVYYALAKGVVLTAAAGNGARKGNPVEDPAVCLGVVAVGAADRAGRPADFSARQPYVTLLAPGVAVPSLSRVAGTAYSGDGTSQATALTSAALALVWSKYPKLTGPQVVARLLATLADRRATPTSSSGYGLLDAGQAVRSSVPTSAPNPVSSAAAPFLARYRALGGSEPTAPPAPPKAATGALPGGYAVGSVPRFSTSRLLLGVGIGVVWLLLLVVLGVGGLRRRRRGPAPGEVFPALVGGAPPGPPLPEPVPPVDASPAPGTAVPVPADQAPSDQAPVDQAPVGQAGSGQASADPTVDDAETSPVRSRPRPRPAPGADPAGNAVRDAGPEHPAGP